MAVAQRLIRGVCKDCKAISPLSPADFKKLKESLPAKILSKYKLTEKTKIPEAKGCKSCNSTGYRGRIGIFEAILFDEKMEKFILQNPSIADFKEEAAKSGMLTMKQDGFIKVLEGKTTIEEVERVTGEE